MLDRELLGYKHAGHGILARAELEEYLRRGTEIVELERRFQENLARGNRGVWFTLELDGVPRDELVKWMARSSEGGQLTADEQHKQEKVSVPFANGGTLAVLTNAHRPETRKRMFLADNLNLKANKPLLEEIVKRRAKQAQFLKYSTHADFRIERRMAKSTKWVRGFLDQLRQPLCSRGREETAVLQRRRLQDLQSRGQDDVQRVEEGFAPWDKRYIE